MPAKPNTDKSFPGGIFPAAKVILFAFILVVILNPAVNAQKKHKVNSPNLILEGRTYFGWTLAHHIEMAPFQRHYPAYEISIVKATFGENRWEYLYDYPWIGITYWYSHLGKTPWLGNAHAFFPHINFPLVKGKNLTFNFRAGLGLGYLTKKFDRIENYKNLSIGSHFNVAVNLLFEIKWEPVKKLILSGGLGLVHFSNGTIKTPNYGINMPNVNVAVAYRISRENREEKKKLMPELEPFEFDGRKKIYFDITVAGAIKDMQSVLGVGNRYYVVTVFGNVMKPTGFKTKLGLGFDLSYDASDVVLLERDGQEPGGFLYVMKKGVNAAFELSFSRAAMFFNLGTYVGGQDKSDGEIYEKFSLRYDITDNLFASIVLKAHLARADFLAIGIGYKFLQYYY